MKPAWEATKDAGGSEQVTGHVTAHVTEQVVQLLRACEGEQRRAELMSALGLVHRVPFRESHLVLCIINCYLPQPQDPARQLE